MQLVLDHQEAQNDLFWEKVTKLWGKSTPQEGAYEVINNPPAVGKISDRG